MILDNILQAIGKTPIVKLNSVGKELDCEIFGKCEYCFFYDYYIQNLLLIALFL